LKAGAKPGFLTTFHLRLQKSHVKYDLRKFGFANRVVNTWNSLPNWIVSANTTNTFKSRLDKFGKIKMLHTILKHNCTELEVAVKVCVKNISKLEYCKVFIRCGHRGFGLRSSTLSTSWFNQLIAFLLKMAYFYIVVPTVHNADDMVKIHNVSELDIHVCYCSLWNYSVVEELQSWNKSESYLNFQRSRKQVRVTCSCCHQSIQDHPWNSQHTINMHYNLLSSSLLVLLSPLSSL